MNRLATPSRTALFLFVVALAAVACTPPAPVDPPDPSGPRVTDLAVGAAHTCVLIEDGTVRCWGQNHRGPVGDGNTIERTTPAAVVGITGAIDVAAGDFHSCAVLADGTAACWGHNDSGQLGDGTTVDALVPVAVAGLSEAVEIAAGFRHTCARRTDGSAACWGSNFDGQLGDGTTADSLTPVPVSGLSGVVGLTAGNAHTCAVLDAGTASCWGNDAWGQLGTGVDWFGPVTTPAPVTGLDDVVSLDAGWIHTCAALADGEARCWGSNSSLIGQPRGQLGNGTTQSSRVPVPVLALSGVTSISGGMDHSCARSSDGSGSCWGGNAAGELGSGSQSDHRAVPGPVVSLPAAATIDVGGGFSCALTVGGQVWCWGANPYGQLGAGSPATHSTVPVKVRGLG